jgi:hypothetical protein
MTNASAKGKPLTQDIILVARHQATVMADVSPNTESVTR